MRLWLVATSAAMALVVASCGKTGATDSDDAAATPPANAPAAAQTAGAASDMPTRKSGLWTQAMTMDGKTHLTSRFCLDDETDKKMKIWGDQAAGNQCTTQGPQRKLDGSFTFSSTCNLDGGITTVSSGTASGDFTSAYTVKVNTRTSGAPADGLNGNHSMEISARWEGACPEGWKPGDMELPGGMRVNAMNGGKPSSMPSGVPDMSQIRKMSPEQLKAMAEAMHGQASR